MKRILNLMLTLALFLTLAPTLAVYAEKQETDYATGLIWDSQETIDGHLRDAAADYETTLPASVDLTDEFPAPRNQGSQNSCAAWAVAYAQRSHMEEQKQGWGLDTNEHLFSPAYVYNQCCGGKNKGMSISQAMELIIDQGVCTLASFPYNSSDYLTQPTEEQRAEAANYKAGGWFTVSGIDKIKKQLAEGNGVIVAFEVFPDFRNLSPANPIYDTVSGSSSSDYSHAVCFIGYDDEMGAFKFINSWGTSWGIGGYGWISYDLMTNPSVVYYREPTGYIMESYVYTEDYYTYTIEDNEAVITRYYGNGGELEIPGELGGYPVTRIGDYAFSNCDNITGITIPDSVKVIGDGAFRYCDSLTGTIAFDSVIEIGYAAFKSCSNLSEVIIGKNVAKIGDEAFYNCRLTYISVDENNQYYTDIDGVLYDKQVTTAIQCPEKKTGSHTIPDSVTVISDYAFSHCNYLSGLKVGSGVRYIGDYAFYYCRALTEVKIPDGVSSIGGCAFASTNLTEIVIPDNVTSIGDGAFLDCRKLERAVIPDSVTEIGWGAFSYIFYGVGAPKPFPLPKHIDI